MARDAVKASPGESRCLFFRQIPAKKREKFCDKLCKFGGNKANASHSSSASPNDLETSLVTVRKRRPQVGDGPCGPSLPPTPPYHHHRPARAENEGLYCSSAAVKRLMMFIRCQSQFELKLWFDSFFFFCFLALPGAQRCNRFSMFTASSLPLLRLFFVFFLEPSSLFSGLSGRLRLSCTAPLLLLHLFFPYA